MAGLSLAHSNARAAWGWAPTRASSVPVAISNSSSCEPLAWALPLHPQGADANAALPLMAKECQVQTLVVCLRSSNAGCLSCGLGRADKFDQAATTQLQTFARTPTH